MSEHPKENPYEVLGVKRDASETEIKRAYFALVRDHPPERDPEGFKRIRAAYERLRGAERARTDVLLVVADPVSLDVAGLRLPGSDFAVTIEMMKEDLLALEALALLEEVHAVEGSD